MQINFTAAERQAIAAFVRQRPRGDSQAELFAAYGDFRPRAGRPTLYGADADWARANIAAFELPVRLLGTRYAKSGNSVVDLHRKVGPIVQIAFRHIKAQGLAGLVKRWNGAWVVRQKRTVGEYSTHSWGIAFDVDAASNGQGGVGSMDPRILQIFEACGLCAGARWSAPFTDFMHLDGSGPLKGVKVPAWQDAGAAVGSAQPLLSTPAPTLTTLDAKGLRLFVDGQELGIIEAASLGAGKLQIRRR